MNFFDYLKNIFIVLIFLQIAPALVKNIKKQYGKMLSPRAHVGLIRVRGVLHNSDRYNKYLNKYFKDKNIKAILLKIDCPGSSAGTAQAIYNEIQSLKKKYDKPIITLVENICASGGYYIASSTDAIITPASSLVGSIGSAFQFLFQLKDFMEQYKIKYKPIVAGKYKDTTDPFTDMTPEQEKMLQSVLDSSYDQFTQDVAKNRKLSLKDKGKWADGKIFTGSQALKLGLVDTIGSAYDAVKKIKDMAMIKDDIIWIKPPKRSGLFRWFGQDPPDEDSMFSAFASKICSFIAHKFCNKRVG